MASSSALPGPPDKRAFSRICPSTGGIDMSRWPATVPAVAQILADGFELPAGVTVLVGENGSGKSTVIELIAEACGLNPQGGWIADRFRTRGSEPGIGQGLWVDRGPGWPTWAYFLRADTMHELFTYLEDNPGLRSQPLHELSRGEGFLEVLRTRINQPGLYLLDEPDAPLSFVSCLGLVALLHDLGEAGAQIIVATHSPMVAAVPGARLLELGDWGIRPASWADLEIVALWREYLRRPGSFLRHLIGEQSPPSA